ERRVRKTQRSDQVVCVRLDDLASVKGRRPEREVAEVKSPRAACGVRREVQPESHPIAEVAAQVDGRGRPDARSGLTEIDAGSEGEVRPIREGGRVGDLEVEAISRILDLARLGDRR